MVLVAVVGNTVTVKSFGIKQTAPVDYFSKQENMQKLHAVGVAWLLCYPIAILRSIALSAFLDRLAFLYNYAVYCTLNCFISQLALCDRFCFNTLHSRIATNLFLILIIVNEFISQPGHLFYSPIKFRPSGSLLSRLYHTGSDTNNYWSQVSLEG